jgi:hypothetical protein
MEFSDYQIKYYDRIEVTYEDNEWEVKFIKYYDRCGEEDYDIQYVNEDEILMDLEVLEEKYKKEHEKKKEEKREIGKRKVRKRKIRKGKKRTRVI